MQLCVENPTALQVEQLQHTIHQISNSSTKNTDISLLEQLRVSLTSVSRIHEAAAEQSTSNEAHESFCSTNYSKIKFLLHIGQILKHLLCFDQYIQSGDLQSAANTVDQARQLAQTSRDLLNDEGLSSVCDTIFDLFLQCKARLKRYATNLFRQMCVLTRKTIQNELHNQQLPPGPTISIHSSLANACGKNKILLPHVLQCLAVCDAQEREFQMLGSNLLEVIVTGLIGNSLIGKPYILRESDSEQRTHDIHVFACKNCDTAENYDVISSKVAQQIYGIMRFLNDVFKHSPEQAHLLNDIIWWGPSNNISDNAVPGVAYQLFKTFQRACMLNSDKPMAVNAADVLARLETQLLESRLLKVARPDDIHKVPVILRYILQNNDRGIFANVVERCEEIACNFRREEIVQTARQICASRFQKLGKGCQSLTIESNCEAGLNDNFERCQISQSANDICQLLLQTGQEVEANVNSDEPWKEQITYALTRAMGDTLLLYEASVQRISMGSLDRMKPLVFHNDLLYLTYVSLESLKRIKANSVNKTKLLIPVSSLVQRMRMKAENLLMSSVATARKELQEVMQNFSITDGHSVETMSKLLAGALQKAQEWSDVYRDILNATISPKCAKYFVDLVVAEVLQHVFAQKVADEIWCHKAAQCITQILEYWEQRFRNKSDLSKYDPCMFPKAVAVRTLLVSHSDNLSLGTTKSSIVQGCSSHEITTLIKMRFSDTPHEENKLLTQLLS